MSVLPTQTELNSYLKSLRDALVEIIGNDLGVYQILDSSGVVQSEIPAIYVEPPALKTNIVKMKENSGIECVISRTPSLSLDYLLGSKKYCADYKISLTQYNNNSSTQNATGKIITDSRFHITQMPITTPYIETAELFIYEKTEIFVKTYVWVS